MRTKRHKVISGMAAVFCAVLAVTAAPAATSALRAAAAFVDGFDDLPMMPVLSQEPGQALVFETPYGRIVESTASGRSSRTDVIAFYAATLPQLGWNRAAESAFEREGETLTLDVTQNGPSVTVRFQGAPAG